MSTRYPAKSRRRLRAPATGKKAHVSKGSVGTRSLPQGADSCIAACNMDVGIVSVDVTVPVPGVTLAGEKVRTRLVTAQRHFDIGRCSAAVHGSLTFCTGKRVVAVHVFHQQRPIRAGSRVRRKQNSKFEIRRGSLYDSSSRELRPPIGTPDRFGVAGMNSSLFVTGSFAVRTARTAHSF